LTRFTGWNPKIAGVGEGRDGKWGLRKRKEGKGEKEKQKVSK